MGPEARLRRIAASQYSVFDHRQALEAGFSASTIQRRVRAGVWKNLYRRVYVDASVRLRWQQLVFGSCLACGPDAVASYDSAEVVWGFTTDVSSVHVTVPIASARRHPAIKIHRSRRQDLARLDGFRVTNPMRTLLDLAPLRQVELVERYLDDAHRRGLIAIQRFERFLAEPDITSRPGTKVLRELLTYRDPEVPIGSDLETMFFRTLRTAGLPLPQLQHPVDTRHGRRYIDFAYPDQRLAIELDGYGERANRFAFEYDRARQNDIEELGWHFRRFTWRQVRADPVDVAFTIGRALGLRPVRWR
jgi:very-short-patch-repair endonuclease